MKNKHTPIAFNMLNINDIGEETGVYAFWFNNRCIYVGKAERQSLKKRLTQHYRNCHSNDLKLWIDVYGCQLKFCFLKLKKQQSIDFLERKFIYRLQPTTNKQLI
jgi:excinuclease UvrABC nuclease subunit